MTEAPTPPTSSPADPAKSDAFLPRRPIARTKLSVTNLTLGTWGLGDEAYGRRSERALEDVVDAAIEQGIRCFDLAPLWGDGLVEEVVGAKIAPIRDECVVVTRAGAVRKGETIVRLFDPESLEASISSSRKRLGTHVDVLLLHDPPEKIVAHGGFAKGLARLAGEGELRTWGVATADVSTAIHAVGLGARLVSVPHSVLTPDVVPAVEAEAQRLGTSLMVRSPLLHGLLTEAGLAGKPFGEGDHRARRWDDAARATRIKQARGLSAVWVQKTRSLTEYALRYALSPACVATASVGPRTPEQVRELCEAVRAVDRLDRELLDKTTQITSVLGV